MPHPFDPNTPHHLFAGALGMRPILAQRIASVTARWSEIEALQGSILAHLVQGDPAAAAALYTAMTNARAQRSALLAVAEARELGPEVLAELVAVIEQVSRRGKERNAIVHGLWGISDAHPDALVHCTLQSWIQLHAATHDFQNYEGETLEDPDQKQWKIRVSRLDMRVYEDSDFRQTIKRMDALKVRMGELFRVLKPDRYALEALLSLGPKPPTEE